MGVQTAPALAHRRGEHKERRNRPQDGEPRALTRNVGDVYVAKEFDCPHPRDSFLKR